MVHYFNFLLQYKDFLYAITNNGYDSLFLIAITEYMLKNRHLDDDNLMEYYALIAFAGSLYNLYISWAKNDFKQTPEEMASVLHSIHNFK